MPFILKKNRATENHRTKEDRGEVNIFSAALRISAVLCGHSSTHQIISSRLATVLYFCILKLYQWH